MNSLLDILDQGEGVLAYVVLAVSAALEYVVPPFPGDTVTLFGAFLITARGWSAVGVLSAVTVGSMAGAAIDFAIGRALARIQTHDREPRWLIERYWLKALGRVRPVVGRLQAKGPYYLVLNRFFPGIRALFFVAAGMAGLRFSTAMLAGAASALLWNALVIGVGAAIGASWERLQRVFETYTTVVGALLAMAAVGLVAWLWIRRRKTSYNGGDSEGGGSAP
jgi:membrane protein DedA with SNARE-associated domain